MTLVVLRLYLFATANAVSILLIPETLSTVCAIFSSAFFPMADTVDSPPIMVIFSILKLFKAASVAALT